MSTTALTFANTRSSKMATILFETDDGEVVGWKLGAKDGPLANVDEGDDSGDAFKERLATVRGTVKFGISDPDELGDFLLGERDIKGWKPLDVDGWLEREMGATTPEQKQAARDRLFGRPVDESKRGPRAPVVKLSDRRKPKGDDDVR